MSTKIVGVPREGLQGLKENWRTDSVSGFLIFLIAMPLCLAIFKANGLPLIAGIHTAITGGILVSLFTGARITIKGPAAGRMVIGVGPVVELGKGANMRGYQLQSFMIFVEGLVQQMEKIEPQPA